jgi:hypothetical protein
LNGEPFVARTSRVRVLLLIAMCPVFVGLSLWVAGMFGEPPAPQKAWIGWIGAPFFTLMAVGWASRLRGNADQIVIDGSGLLSRHWSDDPIPWSAVERIDECRIRNQTFFAVHLADAKAHPPTRLMGKVAAAQAGLGRGHFSLITTGTDRSPDELRETLSFYRPG